MNGIEESKSELATLLDGLPVGVAVVEIPGQILWANPAYIAQTHREQSPRGSDSREMWEELQALSSGIGDAVELALNEGRTTSFRGLRAPLGSEGADGAYLDVDVRGMEFGEGRPRRALITVLDATRRVREEEQARLFYESFLSSTNAIEVTDRNGTIVDVNPAFERIYGYSRTECIGKKPNIVRSKKTPPEIYKRLWSDLLDTGKGHWSGELINRDRRGKEHPVFLAITSVRNGTGEVTHYLGVAVDLTELKAWQRSATQADKLASLGQLAAGVAHEINTPLANVMLVAESIQRRSKDPWVKSRAETIASQVDVAAVIVRGLLDFARRGEPQVALLDLTQVTRDAVTFLRGKQSANVELDESYPPTPVPISGDRGQLIQVLTNLLNNGYEAMEGAGRLRVEVRSHGSDAEVEISDSGPGIADEVLPHIFEPFFTTKPEGQGTGLGLAICHGILQAHHGTILASNRPGGGASFVISLPLNEPASQPRA